MTKNKKLLIVNLLAVGMFFFQSVDASYRDNGGLIKNEIKLATLDVEAEFGVMIPQSSADQRNLMAGESVRKDIEISNIGSKDFKYNMVFEKNSGDELLCDSLILKVDNGFEDLYNGSLSNFDEEILSGLFSGGKDTRNFNISLAENADVQLENLSCDFKFVFTAWQMDFSAPKKGWIDKEELNIIIESGSWSEPVLEMGLLRSMAVENVEEMDKSISPLLAFGSEEGNYLLEISGFINIEEKPLINLKTPTDSDDLISENIFAVNPFKINNLEKGISLEAEFIDNFANQDFTLMAENIFIVKDVDGLKEDEISEKDDEGKGFVKEEEYSSVNSSFIDKSEVYFAKGVKGTSIIAEEGDIVEEEKPALLLADKNIVLLDNDNLIESVSIDNFESPDEKKPEEEDTENEDSEENDFFDIKEEKDELELIEDLEKEKTTDSEIDLKEEGEKSKTVGEECEEEETEIIEEDKETEGAEVGG